MTETRTKLWDMIDSLPDEFLDHRLPCKVTVEPRSVIAQNVCMRTLLYSIANRESEELERLIETEDARQFKPKDFDRWYVLGKGDSQG